MSGDCPSPEFCRAGGCLGRCHVAACTPPAARRAGVPPRPGRVQPSRPAAAPAKRKERP